MDNRTGLGSARLPIFTAYSMTSSFNTAGDYITISGTPIGSTDSQYSFTISSPYEPLMLQSSVESQLARFIESGTCSVAPTALSQVWNTIQYSNLGAWLDFNSEYSYLSSQSLSSGAKMGVGIAISVSVVAIPLLILALSRRHRKRGIRVKKRGEAGKQDTAGGATTIHTTET